VAAAAIQLAYETITIATNFSVRTSLVTAGHQMIQSTARTKGEIIAYFNKIPAAYASLSVNYSSVGV
jgi:hypothetical protein